MSGRPSARAPGSRAPAPAASEAPGRVPPARAVWAGPEAVRRPPAAPTEPGRAWEPTSPAAPSPRARVRAAPARQARPRPVAGRQVRAAAARARAVAPAGRARTWPVAQPRARLRPAVARGTRTWRGTGGTGQGAGRSRAPRAALPDADPSVAGAGGIGCCFRGVRGAAPVPLARRRTPLRRSRCRHLRRACPRSCRRARPAAAATGSRPRFAFARPGGSLLVALRLSSLGIPAPPFRRIDRCHLPGDVHPFSRGNRPTPCHS